MLSLDLALVRPRSILRLFWSPELPLGVLGCSFVARLQTTACVLAPYPKNYLLMAPRQAVSRSDRKLAPIE